MGTSRSAAELSRKLNAAARALPDANREAVKEGAELVKSTTLRHMRSATGGDLVLSGFNRGNGGKGGRVGVKYKMEQRASGPTAFVRATGPAQLIENDVAKHPVVSRYARASEAVGYTTSKGVRRSRASRRARGVAVQAGIATTGDRRAVLHWAGTWRRWTVASSKGRQPWERGVAQSARKVPAIVARRNRQALIRQFG